MPMPAGRPSTMNSLLPAKIPQNSMVVQQRLQISEHQFDKFPTPSTFSCWKMRFKTQVSSCSDFSSEAMLWIKEVEMVDSVMPDARIASASTARGRSVWRYRKPKKRIGFLRARQIANMIYDYFRVAGAHDTVLDYADSFSVSLSNDAVQEFDTRWDEILLSMTMFWKACTSWEYLSVQFKTVLELYDMEIHQKISMPNYQKLKTMVKRSIFQKLRLRNFREHARVDQERPELCRIGYSERL